MTITFDPTKYDGYIFDCDGTIADTMPLHYQAWSETLEKKLGRPSDFSEKMFYSFGGMPARAIVERLNRDYGYGFVAEPLAHEKEMRFLELLPGIGPVPEVVAVLDSLPADAKIAVASGGLSNIVLKTLHFLKIQVGPKEKIKFMIGSDQVKHGKPDPELFLSAAKLLGVEPKRCLVFEDATPGFQAAQAAGMDYIDVRPFRATISAHAQ